MKHIKDQSPISEKQWGFTKGKSKTGALLTAVESWHSELESGNDVCAAFCDFKKAFDIVSHNLLLQKLSALGLDSHLLKWITSYLTHRSQYVSVNSKASGCTQVLSGVPQGSVLGPLLFLLFINDLATLELSDGSLIYADDLLLYRVIRSDSDYQLLQCDIDKLFGQTRTICFLTLSNVNNYIQEAKSTPTSSEFEY